jgi:hypothetical protein
VISLEALQRAFAQLVNAVIGRLSERGIGSALEEDWQSIQETSEEERPFCVAAASLGLDPYSISSDQQKAILAVAEMMPASLVADFFTTASPSSLRQDAAVVLEALARARSNQSDLLSLRALRGRYVYSEEEGAPWEQGAHIAQKLRADLGLDGKPMRTDLDLSKALGIPVDGLLAVTNVASTKLFDAVADVNSFGSPGFTVAHHHPHAQRFAVCRALFEYLSSPSRGSALVTAARSDQQKRNRAFAAEFLVPTSAVLSRIVGDAVTETEIEEVADEFGVSPYVVRNQIVNKRLARVLESD